MSYAGVPTRTYALSFVSMAIGGLVDAATTQLAIDLPEVRETNPLIQASIDIGGFYGILAFKLLMVTLVFGVILHQIPREERARYILMCGVAFGGLWLLAGLWNYRLYLGMVG